MTSVPDSAIEQMLNELDEHDALSSAVISQLRAEAAAGRLADPTLIKAALSVDLAEENTDEDPEADNS